MKPQSVDKQLEDKRAMDGASRLYKPPEQGLRGSKSGFSGSTGVGRRLRAWIRSKIKA